MIVNVMIGCGGPAKPDESAAASVKCNAFVEFYCTRYGECIDATDAEIATCESRLSDAVDCVRAQAVSSGYDRCWDSLADDSCGAVTAALPAACTGVILLPDAVAQCQTLVSQFCDELVSCDFYSDSGSCIQDATVNFECENAVGVSSDYNTCLAQLGGRSCSAVENGIPTACEGAIFMR